MMASRNYGSPQVRPLFIDFDVYTDGDDEFKKELVTLIIENLFELQRTLRLVSKTNDLQLFHKVCHKIKAALDMLQDQELFDTVAQLKLTITDSSLIALLDRLCSDTIESLRRE